MKNLIIISILLLSVSCLTVERIERNCDKFATICEVPVKVETEVLTNTITEIQYRDTSFYYPIPERIVKEKKPVKVKDKKVNSELSVLKVPFAMSTAQVVNSKLSHELVQTDTLILIKLENALKTVKIQEKQIETLKEKYVVTVKENTNFAKLTIKVFWGLLVVIVLGIGYLIFRYKSKILGLFKKLSP